jgi:hypothetical protein
MQSERFSPYLGEKMHLHESAGTYMSGSGANAPWDSSGPATFKTSRRVQAPSATLVLRASPTCFLPFTLASVPPPLSIRAAMRRAKYKYST